MKEIVILGADHNGVDLKESLKAELKQSGFQCVDVGPYTSSESVDYVDYAHQVGQIISNNEADWGILICGTGMGMSIAANKIDNIRAALIHDEEAVSKSREHNDSNILCLGAWIKDDETNIRMTKEWLTSDFGEYRHVKRIEKLVTHSQQSIVFTNGVFDIVHKGHIELLKFSKNLGGKLIVGINSDRAVKILKGDQRPINNEDNRRSILQSIEYVDEVVIFDDEKPTQVIKDLMPNILVKGGEWTASEVRVRDNVPDDIEIKIFPFMKGFSSTNIIENIKEKSSQ
tara:strand:+ start:800 stop:1657 length:858 start_codon:yes stop_codon:yes gene_type:complete